MRTTVTSAIAARTAMKTGRDMRRATLSDATLFDPLRQEAPLHFIRSQRVRALVRGARVVRAAEAAEEVGARGVEEVIRLQLAGKLVDEGQRVGRSASHRHRHRAIE